MRLLPITARKALSLVALTLMGCVCTTVTTSFAPPAHAADANYQLIQEPDAGFAPIIGLISGATRSVRMTMYELTDPAAVNALIDDHNRGVDTRVILDAAFHGRQTNAGSFQQLTDAGVEVRWAPNGVIYHQKTITVDDATAAVGTGNLEPQYYSTSRDAWVLDTNPADVAAIAATFDTDYTSPPSGQAARSHSRTEPHLVADGARQLLAAHRPGHPQYRSHQPRTQRPRGAVSVRQSSEPRCAMPHRYDREPGVDPSRGRSVSRRLLGTPVPEHRIRALHSREDAAHRQHLADHRQPKPFYHKPYREPRTVPCIGHRYRARADLRRGSTFDADYAAASAP